MLWERYEIVMRNLYNSVTSQNVSCNSDASWKYREDTGYWFLWFIGRLWFVVNSNWGNISRRAVESVNALIQADPSPFLDQFDERFWRQISNSRYRSDCPRWRNSYTYCENSYMVSLTCTSPYESDTFTTGIRRGSASFDRSVTEGLSNEACGRSPFDRPSFNSSACPTDMPAWIPRSQSRVLPSNDCVLYFNLLLYNCNNWT